ncbi:MAG: polyribonucleotide nucleotidyltransferase [Acidobacteriota bacterium]|nr:MAG: polyribonucleotide nucleotidyltransferase [Acidobacteriota bacterium]
MPSQGKRDITIGTRTLTLESTGLARQADGAIMARYGDSVVLVTACAQREPREGMSFLPLTVDYREYTYAAGKIPGGFFKREGRPSEKEIITCRLIDRPLRPLFPEGYAYETQIIGMVLSSDQENDTDVHAITSAGAALYLSRIPFTHPLAAVRVGLVEDRLVVCPTFKEREESRLDLVVVGTDEALVMIEASAREVEEAMVLEAIEVARREILKIVEVQKEMYREMGVEKTSFEPIPPVPQEIADDVRGKTLERLKQILPTPVKSEREEATRLLKKEIVEGLTEEEREEKEPFYARAFYELEKSLVREVILKEHRRTDGRAFDRVRDLDCRIGVLPRTHGSAVFRRGETTALVTVTLGTPSDTQTVDALEGETEKRFMLHYNFPPFSVGEVAFMRGPKRREIGHGVLAERALRAVAPTELDFPYTLRVVSDILESNGSSSMATVCGGSLALMEAGVPVSAAVAGIAMGLVKEGDGEGDGYAILTDIAGYEDHYGDMDFKVAGTSGGITALQMDIKVKGVTAQVLKEAFEQARRARLEILDAMNAAIPAPREELSPHAPRMLVIQIDKEDIGAVIGPGGKMIRSIVEETGATIDIEEDGRVFIASVDEKAANEAMRRVKQIVEKPEVGKIYDGKVISLREFGAFVEILPGKDGLLHISEIAPHRIERVEDVLKEGDVIQVKVISQDEQGKLRLSKRAAEGYEPAPAPPRRDDRGRGRGPRRDGGGRGRGPRRDGGGGRGRGPRRDDRPRRDSDRDRRGPPPSR